MKQARVCLNSVHNELALLTAEETVVRNNSANCDLCGICEPCCIQGGKLRKEAHGCCEALFVFPEESMPVSGGVSQLPTCVHNTLIRVRA